VFAENAVAGDLWTPDRARRELDHAVIIGRNVRHLYATPPPVPPTADAMYDRQVRWLGDRGQDRLRRLKVGVIGAGGVGLPLITMLARLGVGWISVVDPDRVEVSNLPRLDVRRSDAMLHLRKLPVLSRFADRLSAHKVRVARRTARRANPNIRFDAIALNVVDPDAASHLVDCDFVFLAADSHQARMAFNALTHQYLIPGIQMGTRIDTVRESGAVADIRSNVRLVIPGNDGCLRCNQLISAAKLQQESLGDRERERNRYVDEVPAPSVITFNTAVAAQAASDFLLMMGGLIHDAAHLDYLRFRPRIRTMERVVALAAQSTCRDCSVDPRSRRGRGDSVLLPLPERPK
jgi:molybdopterin/thiamine biosynthesis adenylyltransferase